MKDRKTERGFNITEFEDSYGAKCSLQKSSSAMEDKIWFGCNNADPQILASKAGAFGVETNEDCGWVKYPIPDEVLLNTRMHLTRKQVKKLLPYLKRFVKTGDLFD